MTHTKHTFLQIPILMVVLHPVFAQAETFEEFFKKPLTENITQRGCNIGEKQIIYSCTTGETPENCINNQKDITSDQKQQLKKCFEQEYDLQRPSLSVDKVLAANRVKGNTTTAPAQATTTVAGNTQQENKADKEKKAALQKKGMVCTDAKQHHLLATYDENGNCVVKSCVFGYDVNEETNKCEEDKSDELTTTLEKAISELTTEFQTKVPQLQPSNREEQ